MISFKLPGNLQVSEVNEIIDDLNKLLEQLLVNQYVDGKIEFQGFESGSSWINMTIGSMLALQLFSGVVNIISESFTKQQEYEAREKMLEDLDIQVEAKKQVLDAIKQKKDDAVNSRITQLKENLEIPSDDHEMEERIKYSINELDKLIGKGLEIHPSLVSPPEIRQSFPDAEEILKTVKLLSPSKDKKSDVVQ